MGAWGILDYLLTKDRPDFLAGFGGILAMVPVASALLFVGGARFLLWLARLRRELPPVMGEEGISAASDGPRPEMARRVGAP